MSRLHLDHEELKNLYTPHLLLKEVILTDLSLTILSFVFLLKKHSLYKFYECELHDNLYALFLTLEDRFINGVISYRVAHLSEQPDSKYYKNAYKLLIEKNLSSLSGIELLYLGVMYCHGHGVSIDIKKGLKYYHLSGDKRCGRAFTNIGYHYQYNIMKDDKKAIFYYEKAISLDENCAKSLLAYMMECGIGVKMNKNRANQLYISAARRNHSFSIYKCEQLNLNY